MRVHKTYNYVTAIVSANITGIAMNKIKFHGSFVVNNSI
jgi:hypothetical protein